jgi:hypothetical protein
MILKTRLFHGIRPFLTPGNGHDHGKYYLTHASRPGKGPLPELPREIKIRGNRGAAVFLFGDGPKQAALRPCRVV